MADSSVGFKDGAFTCWRIDSFKCHRLEYGWIEGLWVEGYGGFEGRIMGFDGDVFGGADFEDDAFPGGGFKDTV